MGDKSPQESKKEDIAINGEVEGKEEEEQETQEKGSGQEEEKGVVTNGLDVSPAEEKKGEDRSDDKVVVTKKVEKNHQRGRRWCYQIHHQICYCHSKG